MIKLNGRKLLMLLRLFLLSNVLGHSNIDITKGYLAKFDTRSEDETIDKIFESESINEDLLLKQLRAISPEKLKELLAKRDE